MRVSRSRLRERFKIRDLSHLLRVAFKELNLKVVPELAFERQNDPEVNNYANSF